MCGVQDCSAASTGSNDEEMSFIDWFLFRCWKTAEIRENG